MSQKFTSLEDAAAKLGMSAERLNELREAGDLRAYKDGPSWKFRTEDIDKMAEEGASDAADSGAPLSLADDDDDDLVLSIEPLEEGDDAESILLAEDELEVSPARPPSTIIGKNEPSEDDDLTLASESSISDEASEPGGSFADLEELELDLEAESSRILDAKDVAAAQKAVEKPPAAEKPSSDLALDDDDLDLDLDLGSDAPEDDASKTGELPSLSGADPSGGSSLMLDTSDSDSDLVLGDGSDMSLSGGDSGINLAPSDSGIALDEVPLDLAGSAIGSALDLAALSAVAAQKDEPGDSLAAGDSLASGDDFLLTPGDDGDDDEEDSSQVVALSDVGAVGDEPVAFEELGDADDDDEDAGELVGFDDAGGDFGGVEAAPAALSAGPAAEFPTWVVVMLSLSLVTMTLCGVMTLDLINTMWSWKEPYTVNSAIMDGILSLIGG